jgi:hypothetical protein
MMISMYADKPDEVDSEDTAGVMIAAYIAKSNIL